MILFLLMGMIESILILILYKLMDIALCNYRKRKYAISSSSVVIITRASSGIGLSTAK